MFAKLLNPILKLLRSESGGTTPSTGTIADASDVALLESVAAGQQQAMATLFDRYGGMVYSVALRVLNDTGRAEDLMQEVFLQLWREPGKFSSGKGSLGAWLAVVARNRAVDVLRGRKPSDPVDEVILTSKMDLSVEIERGLLMEKVRAVMKELPAEQQRSLELAFFEGLTHAEIAQQTGDPLGTVKTRIRSALGSLRKAVEA
ncbi:MAG: sigma-70 family RNA polymerase sigma factor [Acidobacteriota bacterium]|nr:sigma-70 family RNA polymerase sigma factor [Acidobacteriota bacterium]